MEDSSSNSFNRLRMCQRSRHHNYQGRCVYLITFSAEEAYTPLCHIFKNRKDKIIIKLTPAGKAISEQLQRIPEYYPEIRLLKKIIMPDHVHFIIFVLSDLPQKFSAVIAGIKGMCSRYFMEKNPKSDSSQEGLSLFKPKFHDRILLGKGQLDAMIKYVADNPRRLLIRRSHPAFFNNVITLEICDSQYSAYGNFLLLRNPIKMAVVVSRKYSVATLKELKKQWEEIARQQGVLIGAFISKAEQEVKAMAIANGAGIIEIKDQGFKERYSPGPRNLELCAQGRLLEIGYRPYSTRKQEFSRELCLEMNAFAMKLAALPMDAIMRAKSK